MSFQSPSEELPGFFRQLDGIRGYRDTFPDFGNKSDTVPDRKF